MGNACRIHMGGPPPATISASAGVAQLVGAARVASGRVRPEAGRPSATGLARNAAGQAGVPQGSIYGYGVGVTGGAGQTTRVVSTTASSGAGSLAAQVALGGFITFSVSGTIHLTTQLNVPSNTTIAGETAPGSGITLTGWPIQVNGNSRSNIIIRNLRHRGWQGISGRPSVGTGSECFGAINGAHHIVFQGLSMAYHLDECIGFWRGVKDVTIQDCIIGEGHADAVAASHNYAFLIGNDINGINSFGETIRFSVFRNLIYRSEYRNPVVGSDDINNTPATGVQADIANNLVWPGGVTSNTYGTQVYYGGKANVRYNYYGDTVNAAMSDVLGALSYSTGNFSRNGKSTSGSQGSAYSIPAANILPFSTSASTAASFVLNNAGCRVGGLDSYDAAAIAAIQSAGL